MAFLRRSAYNFFAMKFLTCVLVVLGVPYLVLGFVLVGLAVVQEVLLCCHRSYDKLDDLCDTLYGITFKATFVVWPLCLIYMAVTMFID